MSEIDLYQPVLQRLQELFVHVGLPADLDIAALTGASDKIAEKISPVLDILFSFLTANKPDILGTLTDSRWVVAEVKDEPLVLEPIYQLHRYSDLFGSRCAFLITTQRIPLRLKRLCTQVPKIVHASNDAYSFFVLAQFRLDPVDPTQGDFVEWFPEDPFANSVYWR